MLALGRLFPSSAEEEKDYGKEVDSYLQRINESVLLPDRRDAVFQLRDLLVDNTKAQLAFGSHGFPTMCTVLQEHRTEIEMVRAALEAIVQATNQDNRHSPQDVQVGAVNAEQLARTPESVTLLLSLLDDEVGVQDFYVRYHTLQVLKALLTANKRTLQETIMGFPLGVVRLINMLDEQEVIRNEALLLLQHLASDNGEIQKLLAFDGGFDKLFAIIREEGGMDGGIVVQDAMALLGALLAGSAPNQLMFRELGYAAELPSLLQLSPTVPEDEDEDMSEDKQGNFLAVLKVIEVLFMPVGDDQGGAKSSRRQNISVLLQHGALPSLVALALNLDVMQNSHVRAEALACLSWLACDQNNRDMLGSAIATVKTGDSRPLLHAVVRAAINGDTHGEHRAADRLMAIMCDNNPSLQFSIANSLTPNGINTFGSDVIGGLVRRTTVVDMMISSRAASVLSHVVNNNQEVKQRLLSLSLPQQPIGLLGICAQHLGVAITTFGAHPDGQQIVANFAALLVLWLHKFPAAVEAFLESVRQSPFLVGAILSDKQFGAGGVVIRGMCALLLGQCIKFVPQGAATPKEALAAAVRQQIGLPTYTQLLDALVRQLTMVGPGSPSVSRSFQMRLGELVGEIKAEFGIGPPPVSNGQHQQAIPGAVPGPRIAPPPMMPTTAAAVAPPPPPMFGAPPVNKGPAGQQPSHSMPHVQPKPAVSSFLPNGGQPPMQPAPPASASVSAPPGPQYQVHPDRPPTTATNGLNNTSAMETRQITPSMQQPQAGPAPAPAASDNSAQIGRLHAENARLSAEVTELKKQLGLAQQQAKTATANADKLEAELEGLSTAYADLDAHANETQAMLQLLKAEQESNRNAAPAPPVQQQQGLTQEEVDQQVQQAVEQAQQEGDAAMEDLLICLGQEEAKVAALSEALEQVGISPQEVLRDLMAPADEQQEDLT